MTIKSGNGMIFDSPEWGYVYLFRKNGLYKIGTTSTPERRRIQIGGENVHCIHVHYPRMVEKQWMDRFAGKRIRLEGYVGGHTEWFDLDSSDVDWICDHKGYGPEDCGIWLS